MDRAERVFVNCPFDDDYIRIFHAIVFAIHDLGFQARHALIDDAEAVRLKRIHTELANSQYSIHDLSQVELSGRLKVPRFNMPFEAGIAYAMHAAADPVHHVLLLEKVPYQHSASMSDAAGMDAKIHDGDPQKAIRAVRTFLRTKSGRRDLPGETRLAKRYALFEAKLPAAARDGGLSMRELRSWEYVNDMQAIMAAWISENPAPVVTSGRS